MTLIRGAAAGIAEDRSRFATRYRPAVRAYVGNCWRGTPWITHLEDAVRAASDRSHELGVRAEENGER